MAIKYQQTDAVLNGFDVAASLKPSPALEWLSKFSFLQAKNKKINIKEKNFKILRFNNYFLQITIFFNHLLDT